MRKVSRMLDHLLDSDYNNEMRPGATEDEVTRVKVNIAVTTLGPVQDDKEMLIFTCYLRQSWTDSRLKFTQFMGLNMTQLSLNWIFLDTIWKPDTYIIGGRDSFLHRYVTLMTNLSVVDVTIIRITSPNRLVRLAEDGTISYSQRLTLATKCKMNLRYLLN